MHCVLVDIEFREYYVVQSHFMTLLAAIVLFNDLQLSLEALSYLVKLFFITVIFLFNKLCNVLKRSEVEIQESVKDTAVLIEHIGVYLQTAVQIANFKPICGSLMESI